MAHQNTRYSDFDSLVHRHGSYIRRLCWWHASGHSEECADLMQDCLTALWHYRHTLRADATPAQERLWVKLHCRSVFSHRRRIPELPLAPLDENHADNEPSDNNRALINALAINLSTHEHHILSLILDGYSVAEIATLLGTKAASVSQTRYRIIEKMKKEIPNVL